MVEAEKEIAKETERPPKDIEVASSKTMKKKLT